MITTVLLKLHQVTFGNIQKKNTKYSVSVFILEILTFWEEIPAGAVPAAGIGCRDLTQGRTNCGKQRFFRTRHQASQYLLHFAPHLLDRVEIGTVRRKKTQFSMTRIDNLFHFLRFVRTQIVHDNNISWTQNGGKYLLNVRLKYLLV